MTISRNAFVNVIYKFTTTLKPQCAHGASYFIAVIVSFEFRIANINIIMSTSQPWPYTTATHLTLKVVYYILWKNVDVVHYVCWLEFIDETGLICTSWSIPEMIGIAAANVGMWDEKMYMLSTLGSKYHFSLLAEKRMYTMSTGRQHVQIFSISRFDMAL